MTDTGRLGVFVSLWSSVLSPLPMCRVYDFWCLSRIQYLYSTRARWALIRTASFPADPTCCVLGRAHGEVHAQLLLC